jgi:hypothetical protein
VNSNIQIHGLKPWGFPSSHGGSSKTMRVQY